MAVGAGTEDLEGGLGGQEGEVAESFVADLAAFAVGAPQQAGRVDASFVVATT